MPTNRDGKVKLGARRVTAVSIRYDGTVARFTGSEAVAEAKLFADGLKCGWSIDVETEEQ